MDPKQVDCMIASCGIATRPPPAAAPANPLLFGGHKMKKSTSELNLEKFLTEISNGSDNLSWKEERISEVGVQRTKLYGEEEATAADGFLTAGDPNFGFGDRNTLNGFSGQSGITDNFVWSQNLNPRQSNISANMDCHSSICGMNPGHSSISANMDCHSSICGPASSGLTFANTGTGSVGSSTPTKEPSTADIIGSAGSPTSTQEPGNAETTQAQGNTSGSSREQSDDDDLEAGPCEQSKDSIDLKRKRRMVSNRESARRSRRRKQEHLVELENQVEKLRDDNASLYKQLHDAQQQFVEAATDNRVFKSDVEALRVKVKLAEDMVARGTVSYSLNNLLLNRSVSPQPMNSNNLSCISDLCPTSGIRSDCTSPFIGTSSINGQIAGLALDQNGDHNPSGILKNKISSNPLPLHRINGCLELTQNSIVTDALSCLSEISWPWESQVVPMSSRQS